MDLTEKRDTVYLLEVSPCFRVDIFNIKTLKQLLSFLLKEIRDQRVF